MFGHAVTVVLERFGPAVVLGGELEKTGDENYQSTLGLLSKLSI